MTITSIEKTKKGRYSIFVEGEFVFSVSADQIVMDKIQIGNQVSADDLRRMLDKSQELYAKQRAVNLLGARSYTKKGLRDKLLEIADAHVVDGIVNHLEEMGYINDYDYAVRKSNDLYKIKKYGLSRVRMALIQKGIDKDLAETVARETQPQDVHENIYSIIQKKYRKVFQSIEDKQDYYKKRMKIQNALVRMGYHYEDINKAIADYIEENEIEY